MIGARCELSEKGRKRGTRQRYRKGVKVEYAGKVVGESHDGSCWRILWDGRRQVTAMHKSFIAVLGLPDDTPASAGLTELPVNT